MRLFLTGRPGVGKTTLIVNLMESMKEVKFGGFITPEVRERERRVGFKLVDVLTGESTWLAKEGGSSVGRYAIMKEAGTLGLASVRRAIKEADVIIMDEVGPMELKLLELKAGIQEALTSDKPVVGTVHRTVRDLGVDYERITVTEENRSSLLPVLISRLRSVLREGT
jgi:Predicted nucleotide kinase